MCVPDKIYTYENFIAVWNGRSPTLRHWQSSTKQGTWIDGSQRIGLGLAAAAPGNLSVIHDDQHHPRSPGCSRREAQKSEFLQALWVILVLLHTEVWEPLVKTMTRSLHSEGGQLRAELVREDLSGSKWDLGNGYERGGRGTTAGWSWTVHTLPNPWHGFPLGLHGFMQMKRANPFTLTLGGLIHWITPV